VEQVALNRHEQYFQNNVADVISHRLRQCQPYPQITQIQKTNLCNLWILTTFRRKFERRHLVIVADEEDVAD